MATEIDLGKVTGDKGEQGDPGSQWYYGTAITGTESPGTVFHGSGIENATVNDKYLNTGTGSDSGNVYTCVLAGDADTAQWSYAGSIRGAQGPQGPQGTTGAVDENTPIEFKEATTLTNLSSGESISVLFGKVAKSVSGLLSGAASTLLSALTANRALISDNNGKVAPSSVTKKELEYLSGAQSNIQDQLDTLTQNMSDFEDDLSGKQNKISNQTFKFTPNDAGITTSSIQCFRYGNVCIVTGIFTPNQAGTPLTLGSFNVHPTQNITFPITGYEKVASYGTLSASGVFQCNIPGAMANAPCVINFAFLTA